MARWAAAVLLLATITVGAVAACEEPPAAVLRVPDAAAAEAAARTFYAGAHGAGASVSEVQVRRTTRSTIGGRDTWDVEIVGTVTEPAGTAYGSAMILRIDATTGAVTVFAQG